MVMRFRSLGSGSTGNATLVQTTSPGACNLLIDCGFGLKQMEGRLEKAGLLPQDLSAIFITHEHGDHIGCVQALSAKYSIPVWMSAGTCAGLDFGDAAGLLNLASDGQAIDLGSLQITPFTVPHDARAPLQLTCTDGSAKLGVLTDVGHITDHVLHHLHGSHALLLECNHDADMLSASSYPGFLKQRVGGDHGHLSNHQAAGVARAIQQGNLRRVVAAHLSQQNNRPDLARQALANALSCSMHEIVVATADGGCDWQDVQPLAWS